MRKIEICAAVAFSLCLAGEAYSQAGGKVQVLSTPKEIRRLSLREAVKPLTVPYPGHIDPDRQIYARVFLDSLQDLTVTYPRQTPHGQCVVYTHTGRFLVGHANDGQLLISDVVDFVETLRRQDRVEVTLVLEEGQDEEEGKPLYLQPGSVGTYFSNAMVVPLIASSKVRTAWKDEEIAKQKENAGGGFWKDVFGGPVSAAHTKPDDTHVVTPAAPSKWPATLAAASPDCLKANPLPFKPLPGISTADAINPDVLTPVAERFATNCGE